MSRYPRPLSAHKEPRSQARVLHDLVMRGDRYQIVELTGSGPEPVGERFRYSFPECVRDIATGDGVGGRTLAVVASNFTDGTSEIIDHDKLVAAVYDYVTRECLDDPEAKWDCPFLDESRPHWRSVFKQEWDSERRHQDEKRFHAGCGR